MRHISFLVKRATDDRMAVRDRYLTVTAAHRDGMLTRLTPSYWTRHALVLKSIETTVTKGLASYNNVRLRRVAQLNPQTGDYLKRRLEEDREANVTRTEALINQLRGWRLSTLEMLLEAGEKDLVDMVRSGGAPAESWFREFTSYSDALSGATGEGAENSLNDAREALPHLAVEDLSELTGNDRTEAELIIRLSDTLRREYLNREQAPVSSSHHHGMETEAVINRTRYVSVPLAVLIVQRPELMGQIIPYIENHELPVTSAEVGHFREYAETPAPAMADGIL